MSGTIWRIEDPEPNPTPPGVVPGSWVSLHYLRSTLQRRWRVVAATAAAGLMVALVALFALPTSATASATVLLAHDPAVDPATALATDQSLLETRIVAQKVIDELHLGLSPDDFLSTFYLAVTAPVLVAPAMNVWMWEHPATQANLAVLKARGVRVLEPEAGSLACGDEGIGRMAEPESIVAAALGTGKKKLRGRLKDAASS